MEFGTTSVLFTITRFASHMLPGILDHVERIEKADPTEIARIAVSKAREAIQEHGLGPISPRSVELIAVTFASIAIDLKDAAGEDDCDSGPKAKPPDVLLDLKRRMNTPKG